MRNAWLSQTRSNWVFWLDSGELLEKADLIKIWEIVSADSSMFPDLVVCAVHQSGLGRHKDIDVKIWDDIRLHKRTTDRIFRGKLRPSLLTTSMCARNLAWTDIRIERRCREETPTVDVDEFDCDAADLEDQIELTNKFVEHSQYERALRLLEKILESDELHWFRRKVFAIQMQCLIGLSQYDAAIGVRQAAKKFHPVDDELYYLEGVARYELGQHNRAIATLQLAAKGAPRCREFSVHDCSIGRYLAHYQMAKSYAQLKMFDIADVLLQTVTETAPLFRPAFVALLNIRLRLKKWNDAYRLTNQWHRRTDDAGFAELLRAKICQSRGDSQTSRRHLEAAIRFAPKDVACLQELYEHFVRHGPDEEIEPVFNQLRRLEPTSSTLHSKFTEYLNRRDKSCHGRMPTQIS